MKWLILGESLKGQEAAYVMTRTKEEDLGPMSVTVTNDLLFPTSQQPGWGTGCQPRGLFGIPDPQKQICMSWGAGVRGGDCTLVVLWYGA